MRIGIPKEIKTNENRVSLVPAGAGAPAAAGPTQRVGEGGGVRWAGVPGVAPAKVVVLGGGVVGVNAAKIAAGMGAKVSILDVSLERLRYLSDVMPANVTLIYSDRHNILEQISTADLVVGGVLIPGAKAPKP